MTRQAPPTSHGSKRYRRWWLFAAAIAAAGCLALTVFLLVLIHYPAAARPLVEQMLTTQSGLDVHIGHLELDIAPLRLAARNVSIAPRPAAAGFRFEAQSLEMRARLRGPFGRRILTIDMLRIEQATLAVSQPFDFSRLDTGPSGFIERGFERLVRFFGYSELRLRRVEVIGARAVYRTGGQVATVSLTKVHTRANGDVQVDGRARLENAAGTVVIDWPLFQATIPLTALSSSGRWTGRMQLQNGRIQFGAQGVTDLKARGQVVYQPPPEPALGLQMTAHGRMAAIPGADDSASAQEAVTLVVDGTYRTAQRRLTFSKWTLSSRDWLALHGSARLDAVSPFPFKLQVSGGRIDWAALLHRLQLSRPGKVPAVTLSGQSGVAGQLHGRFEEPPESWRFTVSTRLDQAPLVGRIADSRLEGLVSGRLQFSGRLFKPLLQTDVTLAAATLTGIPVVLAPFEASIHAEGRYPEYRTDWQVRIPEAGLATAGRDYRLEQIFVSAQKGAIDLKTGRADFSSVTLSSNRLENLQMAIGGSKQGVILRLSGRNVGWISAAADWGLVPAGWQVQSGDRLSATLIVDNGRNVMIDTQLVLPNINAVGKGERYIFEDLQANVDVGLRRAATMPQWDIAVRISVDRGEALLGRYYHSLETHPLTLDGRGALRFDGRQVVVDDLRCELEGLLALNADGNLSMGRQTVLSAAVRLPETRLAPLIRQFVQEPYQFETPALKTLSVDGKVSAELQTHHRRDGWKIRGRLAWNDGRLSFQDGLLAASGIELDFPIWHHPDTGLAAVETMPGRFKAAVLRLPRLPPQPVNLSFDAGPDRLTTTSPVRITVDDGGFQLDTIYVASLYSGRPRLTSRLTVREVPLDSLFGGGVPVCGGGRLNGDLERVRWFDNTLRSLGTLNADLCGGRIEIIDPAVRKVFSAAPSIGFDSRIEAVDLARLTEGTAFGRIQGILNGWVRDLQIVGGQPQAFDLRLETEKTPGVPQKINVRAVQNIASLGGGGNPFVGLAGTLLEAFKDFSYRKIGIRASLANDTFRINGTVREGGTEYLVKKGGFSGVDVVNLNPDNRISFKDMLKRIQRIKQSKGAPVVQ